MEKVKLLAVCKAREEEAAKRIAMGQHRERQEKIAKASTAVIKALCEVDNLTLGIAKNALQIAAETLEDVTRSETIS